MIEEKLNKIDDMSRSIDRISHDLGNLNLQAFPPNIHEPIKASLATSKMTYFTKVSY